MELAGHSLRQFQVPIASCACADVRITFSPTMAMTTHRTHTLQMHWIANPIGMDEAQAGWRLATEGDSICGISKNAP